MVVQKSDNSFEEYSIEKVRNGICEAYTSVGEECPEILIESLAKNLYIYDKIKTSEIRRQVEECLMSFDKRVAKAYIAKFDEIDANGKLLKRKKDFITNYIDASNASTGSKYDPNANVSNKNIATLNAEIPKQGNIQFNRYNTSNKIASMFSKKLAKQYIEDLESHIIYKNDESTFGINSPYCVAVQSYPFLIGGLKGLGGQSSAPKNIDSFCGSFVNFIFAVSSQFAGACLHHSQPLAITSPSGDTQSIPVKDFVDSMFLKASTTAEFYNEQGHWQYSDISKLGYSVEENGKKVKVNKVFKRTYQDQIYEIISKSGLVAKVSKDHKFKKLQGEEFVTTKAEDLKVGDEVEVSSYICKGNTDEIVEISKTDNDERFVYEIETESHWYNCGGYITHNCAVAGFFNMMDYFLRKEWGNDYYQHEDEATRFKFVDGKKEGISISKQIDQYFQQIVYSINIPSASRGFQSA